MIAFLFHAILFFVLSLDAYYFVSYLLSFEGESQDEKHTPFLSVVIPVFNDEDTIGECVASVLQSDYSDFEVIVVDDGSGDSTFSLLQKIGGIRAFTKKHEGKYAALNFGIDKARGDIVTIDADTIVERDTLGHLAHALKEYDVVAGNLRVSDDGALASCQAVEHIRASMYRRMASKKGKIDMVPGPIGAFRRKVFEKVRFERNLVEDFDLAIKIKDAGFRIGYEPRALAYTAMPSELKAFFSQRARWASGNLILARKKKIPFSKIFYSLLIATADMLVLILSLLTENYSLLLLLFSFESLTMVAGNHMEKGKKFFASLLFPLFMWFLDASILLTYSYAFTRTSTSAQSQEW